MSPQRSMQSLVQQYLDERRSLGFALAISGSQLMTFARFVDQSGYRGPLSCRIILDWVQGQIPLARRITWARRLEVVRSFAKYRARFDSRTEVPDARLFGKGHRRLTPHIYTDQEILELLQAAREMTPQGTLRPATYEGLFGLIAATGLRISEALHLRCADADLVQGMLTIRQTKFSKSRLVPLHATANEALQKYTASRQLYVPVRPEAFFFVSSSGAGLVNRTVHSAFERLRAELGWIARGTHAAPRIHDLRHTFICRRVQQWHQHGATIDNAMVALSTYVGHAKVSNTYWYLTGVPELMAIAGRNFEQFASKSKEGGRG
jgi:integrase